LDGNSTTTGASYQWTTTTGTLTGSTTQDDATATAAGAYTLTVTDPTNGCTNTATVSVTGLPPLSATSTTTQVLCTGDTTGTATLTAQFGTPGYTWSFTPSATATITSTTATLTGLGAGNYSYLITDAAGCVLAGNFSITQPATALSLTLQTTADNCAQNQGSIIATATGGSGTLSYSWNPNSSTTNTATNLSAGNYTVTVSDTNNCSQSQSTTITAPPPLNLQAIATPGVVCKGEAVQLQATATGGTPNYTFQWQPQNTSGAQQTTTPLTTTTYTVTVSDTNGCQNIATITTVVNQLPNPSFTTDLTQGCIPACITFSAQTANPGSSYQYSWNFGDGNTSTTTGTNTASNCYIQAGSYSPQLIITDNNGCSDSSTIANPITAHQNPTAAFSYIPTQTTILSPTVFFTDQSTPPQSAQLTNWSWSLGDITNATFTQQNPSFTYPDTGCYQIILTVTDNNGCQSTATDTLCIDPDVTLFIPNAFTPNGDGRNDVFLPQGIGIDPNQYELLIFDRWGDLIFVTTDLNQGWDGRANKGKEIAQMDTYVWKIKCRDVLGKQHDKMGRVTLVR
jgi:gliding motility-associated-like protein